MKQDDVECNGVPYGSLSENKGPLMSPHTKPAEEFKTTIQSEDKSFLGLASRSARENSPGASIAAPVSEGTIVSVSELGSNVLTSSVLVFDKPKEANSPHLFGLSSTAADKSPLLSSESIRRVESEPERPTRLVILYALHQMSSFCDSLHLNILYACEAWPMFRHQLALKLELLSQTQDFI